MLVPTPETPPQTGGGQPSELGGVTLAKPLNLLWLLLLALVYLGRKEEWRRRYLTAKFVRLGW